MKARYHMLALFAACTLVAPGVFAQGPHHDADNGPIRTGNGVPTTVVSRAFTSAALQSPSGTASGKVRTATIVTTNRGTQQGLKLQANGLTPNTEYSLVIDNTLVGTGTSNADGVLRMAFALPATGRAAALPEAITPIALARTVSLFAGQTLVASGEFRGGPRNGGGDGGGR